MELALSLIALISFFASYIMLEQQKKLTALYKEMAESEKRFNDAVIKFCLTRIMKDSAEKEDFETAERCRVLLEKFTSK